MSIVLAAVAGAILGYSENIGYVILVPSILYSNVLLTLMFCVYSLKTNTNFTKIRKLK